MIYATRRIIPQNHPGDAACIRPGTCGICGIDEPLDQIAGTWFCQRCCRAFIAGFYAAKACPPGPYPRGWE